jgi:hypothetical protein
VLTTAAVAEIKRLGGEPKIIGERVFKTIKDDQPRKRRPGLRVQMYATFAHTLH